MVDEGRNTGYYETFILYRFNLSILYYYYYGNTVFTVLSGSTWLVQRE